MKKKNKEDKRGFVYSTDPDFRFENEDEQSRETLMPEQQKLRVRLETKHRGGKSATLISGFVGKEEDLQKLGREIKNHCGTGGSVKEGEIIIQGDQKAKVLQWFVKNHYRQSK